MSALEATCRSDSTQTQTSSPPRGNAGIYPRAAVSKSLQEDLIARSATWHAHVCKAGKCCKKFCQPLEQPRAYTVNDAGMDPAQG